MTNSKYHEMELATTHPTGAEEWYCPTCGRRFLMHWPPQYEKIILEVGDEYALHAGGKGGLQMEAPQMNPQSSHDQEVEVPLSEDLRAALEDALRDIDLDNLLGPVD